MRNGLPEDLARQYAKQAVQNAMGGQVPGTMGKIMMKLRSLRGHPDTSKRGGAS